MQLIMNDWFKAARKKLCTHSNKYTFIKNGKTFSGTRCNPYKGPATQLQIQQRTSFAQASALRSLVLNDDQLKATWRQRYALDTTTKCLCLSDYVMSMALKGHIDSDGSYK